MKIPSEIVVALYVSIIQNHFEISDRSIHRKSEIFFRQNFELDRCYWDEIRKQTTHIYYKINGNSVYLNKSNRFPIQ